MSKGNGKKQGIAENFKPVESLFRRFIPGLLLAAFVLLSMASLLSIQRLQGDARRYPAADQTRDECGGKR